MGWKYTKELLEPVVEQASSVAEVLRLLGVRQNGGAHAHLSRSIKRLGLDTSHFASPSPPGWQERRDFDQVLVRRPPGSPRRKRALLRRAMVEAGIPYECATCGNDGVWQGTPLRLQVDHIDGDFLNDRSENLRFLCPNCHQLTPNFAGRSKGRFADDDQGGVRKPKQPGA